MLKKLLLTVVCVTMYTFTAFAQSGSITGSITDASTGEPLVGATVYIESLQRGSGTDIDGNYAIPRVPAGTYTITSNYIGYKKFSATIEVGSGELVLNITLKSDLIGLEEVVITGFGAIDRAAFTGTVSTVSADQFESVPVASIDQALQGNAAGVYVTANSGTPGSEQEIRIRGISSVNAGVEPLFVIDGVPVVSGENSQSTATSSLGILSSINQEDIETITILKDAASTAPYGARGTNGVIVITTKKGRSGNTIYSAGYQRGYNNPAVEGEKAMNAADYNTYVGAATGTDMQARGLWNGTTDTDWGAIGRNEDAVQESFNFSARGGNDVTTFYASVGTFAQEGPVYGSNLDRFTGSFDVSHQLDDRVRVQNSITGSFVDQDGILEGGGFFGSPVLATYFLLPTDEAYNEDGSPNLNLNTSPYNPIYTQDNDIDRKRNYRLINNLSVDVDLRDNLSFTTRFSLDYLQSEEKYYNNPFYGDSDDTRGSVTENANRNFNYVWQNILTYIWSPNLQNNFTFKAISESQRNYRSVLGGSGEGFAASGLINLNSASTTTGIEGSTTDWAVQSFTGLVNYGFNNKIFADASYRYEGNSRFADSERWGSFWSLGVGYVLTEESFMDDLSFIDFLKVRASYGKTGNAAVGLNAYQSVVGFGSYAGNSTIFTAQLGNPVLTWEEAFAYDIGVEFEMIEKVSGSVTMFRKDSESLLFDVPLSLTTGFDGSEQNIGKLYNKGIEIELNYDVIRNRDFSWNIGGNFATLKNEVTELPKDGNGEDITITTGTRNVAVTGFELNAWNMREWAGVDPANGNPLWYMDVLDGDGNPTGERTTTSVYNSADLYYQGASALPTKTGGFNTRITVKDFYVSANLYYSFGNKVFDNWAFYTRSDGQFARSFGQYQRQADFWTPDNPDAENPAPGLGLRSNSTSSRFLYDGDFLRLKTVNFGYNIPSSYLEKIGLKSASLYFVGQNLWTYVFDEDLNLDPEVRASGFTSLAAAPLKSVTLGAKINF